MGTRSRFIVAVTAWLLVVAAAAFGLASNETQQQNSLSERFASRADTGADFVGAYVDDVFATQGRLIERLDRDVANPEAFAELTAIAGFETAVVLDAEGDVVAVSPQSPDTIGTDLSDRPDLAAALAGSRATSDLVQSPVDEKPVVAFTQPVAAAGFGAFSSGIDLADSPLKTLLGRQPIAGTRGYLLDSTNAIIVAGGEGARSSVSSRMASEALDVPMVSGDYLVAASPVPGTGWTYMLEAPADNVFEPVSGARSQWLALGALGLIGLAVVLFAARAMTAREVARREKASADERLRLTVEHAPIGMAMLDLDQRFVEPNAKLCEMLDYPIAELEKLSLADVSRDGEVGLDEAQIAALLGGTLGHHESVMRLVTKSGQVIEGRTSVSVVRDASGTPQHYVAQIEDVTEMRAAQLELERRAHYDVLTGLPNRSMLLDSLEQALANPETAAGVAVGFCDLDHFKQINDTDGHGAGDVVLREVAQRLASAVREDDLVGRMGGDEFVVMLRNIRSPDEAELVLERARHAIEQPIVDGDREHRVSLSGGLAFALPYDSANRLLSNADMALYAAKRAGRNRVETYVPVMRADAPTPDDEIQSDATSHAPERRRSIVAAVPEAPDPVSVNMEQVIRDALEHDRVALAYQPVLDLTTGLLVGVEALLRLSDEDGVTIAPFQVIGVAEQSGLIVDLGWRVLQLATIQGGAWRDAHGVIVPVAVNVSAVQLQSDDFLTDVRAAVARAGLPAHALTLELTESVMLTGESPGAEQLHALRKAGFELAIDDFGTGYASLSYLHELPASTLKIDQTFVAGLPADRRAVAIVAGVVALARHCGISCIAEGIETEAQRAHLARLGVLGQGYLLGRPGPAAAIGSLIEQGRSDLPRSSASGERASGTSRDPVTGALWRDPGMKELDREVARARRSATSLVLAFVRVEKADQADRQAPDRALVAVAVALQSCLRAYDLVVRYGEDELVCAMVGTPLAEVDGRISTVAEQIRLLHEEVSIQLELAEMRPGEGLDNMVARVALART